MGEFAAWGSVAELAAAAADTWDGAADGAGGTDAACAAAVCLQG
jgi:hypothetical protein